MTMSAIERHSNWPVCDRLDGVDLRDGETLIMEWPDGQLERVTISVVTRGEECNAHVKRFYRGVQVEVPLIGLHAQRVPSD